ncbi:MAG: hypothetical protein NTX03_08100 [Bacteroidetes bacterium]|nr:hypothetical protein [Bacteroidota bacterium]
MRKFLFILIAFLTFGCGGYIHIEKQEEFASQRSKMDKIIVLQPDFFVVKDGYNYKNSYCYKKEKIIEKSYARLSKRFGREMVMSSNGESIDPEYYNTVMRLKKEIMIASGIFDYQSDKSYEGKKTTLPLSTNLIISPDYNQLQKKYGSAYFSYSYFIESDGIFMLTVVADIFQSKIIYREAKRVHVSAKKDNLDRMLFNSYYSLFTDK